MLKVIGLYFFTMTTWLYATESSFEGELLWVWVAMFALAVVAIGILFVSSRKTANIEMFHKKMLEHQKEMELKQTQIMANMTENIHDVAQKALQHGHAAIQGCENSTVEKEAMMEEVEDRLLGVTNDLIYFLKLKSQKIEINNKSFNLNNVLNEVSGMTCSKFSGKKVEFIFDVDNSVPRYIVGDSLHFGRILGNIFNSMLPNLETGELRLDVTSSNITDDKVQLQFKFEDTGEGLSEQERESLFVPYYNEENGEYERLGLYIAQELTSLMDGSLNIHSSEGKGMIFLLELPFKLMDANNKRKYRLPDKSLTEKKVFISDTNDNSALAIKKMFAYFRHEVTIISQEDFNLSMPKLDSYDIIIINESLFSGRLNNQISEIKEKKEIKVIALNSLIDVQPSQFLDGLVDVHLFKPLNQERVFELIVDLYAPSIPKVLLDMEVENGNEEDDSFKIKVYKSNIQETKGITKESFSDFSGKRLLIVEDNVINQKVLLSILAKSGMKIVVANDGQEAVEIVKSGKDKIDFILMDINMPVMDGFTATQVIREDKKFDTIPIVAFTALILESEKQKMFASGINAFLAKPLNLGKLYTSMSMYISDTAILSAKAESKKEKMAVFDGLDIQKGIEHTNRSEALYLELLKEFLEAYGESDESIKTLVNEKRFEQIKMLCIDMRGLSGTIGAYGLQAIVNQMHQHILYKKVDLLDNALKLYQEELSKVKNAVKSYIFTKED